MKFISFMLISLGIIGLLLIALSIITIFYSGAGDVGKSISYLSISTGLLYLLFILTIYKMSDKLV
jgi:hypothetical protein